MFVFIMGLIFSTQLQAKILTVTLAQVKDHVITSREVKINKLIDGVLHNRFEGLPVNREIENSIREWLLFFEASTFYNSDVSKEKIDEALKTAKNQLANSDAWKALAVTDKELREAVARKLESDRLYEFKKKASLLPVTSSEIETEYTQNRIKYGSMSLDEAREKIRQSKGQENLQQRLQQWFVVLEKKHRVQRFSEFSAL